jgi:hypothetical protein
LFGGFGVFSIVLVAPVAVTFDTATGVILAVEVVAPIAVAFIELAIDAVVAIALPVAI